MPVLVIVMRANTDANNDHDATDDEEWKTVNNEAECSAEDTTTNNEPKTANEEDKEEGKDPS